MDHSALDSVAAVATMTSGPPPCDVERGGDLGLRRRAVVRREVAQEQPAFSCAAASSPRRPAEATDVDAALPFARTPARAGTSSRTTSRWIAGGARRGLDGGDRARDDGAKSSFRMRYSRTPAAAERGASVEEAAEMARREGTPPGERGGGARTPASHCCGGDARPDAEG